MQQTQDSLTELSETREDFKNRKKQSELELLRTVVSKGLKVNNRDPSA